MIKKISVIIPLFNEQNNIVKLVNEIGNELTKKIQYEIIIVDDGSNDNTPSVLKMLSKKNNNITILTHKRNYGQSIALRTGIYHARNDYIVTLDGDGQNDPKDILKLIKHFNVKCTYMMIIGNRVNRIDSNAKKIASRLAFKARKILLKDQTPDTGCALKVFRKKDFLELPFFNHIHRFLPFLFNTYKGKVISIKVNHRSRNSGISKYSNFQRFLVGINDIYGVLWLRKRIIWPVQLNKNKNFKSIMRSKNGN
jgi:dolichol-phosphate mannosyltransferase